MNAHNPTHARPGRRSRAERRGVAAFTAIEVLMSLSVLAVGVIGIFSMEKVTLSSNMHAKNLSIATHIAQGWLGVLEAEATLWDNTPLSLGRTTWLSAGPVPPDWFRPAPSPEFGPEFDELGNPVGGNGRFCVDLRISPLNGAAAEQEGIGLRRVEVRVYWLRENAILTSTLTAPAFPCGLPPLNVGREDEGRLFHFVYLSGAVRQVVP